MEIIKNVFKKIYVNTFHEDSMLGIKQITKKNLPFFISWIIIIVWLDCYALPIGAINDIQHFSRISATSFFSYFYTIATAVFICILNVRKLLPYVKYSVIIAMMGVIFEKCLSTSQFSYIGVIFAAIGLGHIYASAGYGFFIILNNPEKLYSISIGMFLAKSILLLKTNYADINLGINIFEIMEFVWFVPIFACALFYKKPDNEEPFESGNKLLLKDYAALILVFVVFIFNDFLAPALWHSIKNISPSNLNIYYSIGVLIGIIAIIFMQQILRYNICYALNFSLTILTLGFIINALAYSRGWFLLSTFLFGISYSISIISIYYMMGIVVKKLRSLLFYRIGVLSSVIFYIFGFSVFDTLNDGISEDIFSITIIIAVTIIMIVFALTPFFTKIFYSAEWTDDLHRPDVTHVNRLTASLKELKLSPKEIQVCILLLDGFTMRQISAVLNIAYSTVNTYCTSIYRKLEINSKTELLVMFSEYLSK